VLGVPSPTIPLPPGLELAGRYRLGAPVRLGATNSYLAHDVVRDQAVVVKLLAAMPFDVDLERVEASVAPLRSFDAACLPRCFELCEARLQDRHCVLLVQEHIEGESLEERLLRTGPLPPAEVRALARRLLELARDLAQHDPPLVHGDINPRNLIFLGQQGGVALVDWGPPKAAARDWSDDRYGPEGWTQATDRAFVAPEVPMGSINARSDLYGVGACLAYALTGLEPEALRDRDPRRSLPRSLEQLHVPRSLASVLAPLLEGTLERRLASPQEALDRLLDPLAGRRGDGPRRRGEPVDWHMEPDPRWGPIWSVGGVSLAALLAAPMVAAALAVALPVGFGMAGWLIALRLGLGLALGLVALLLLRAGVRAFSPMGRLRLQGVGRALRLRQRRDWVEIPWLQLGRVRRFGPLLRIDGAWSVPPEILPKRRVVWIAPVYEDGLDRLTARLGAHRARAQSLLSSSLRHGQRRWPGARRPPLALGLPAGLLLLGGALLTFGWGSGEPEQDGGVVLTPAPDPDGAPAHGAGGAVLTDEGTPDRPDLTELATMRPAETPEEARAQALAAAEVAASLAGEVAAPSDDGPTGSEPRALVVEPTALSARSPAGFEPRPLAPELGVGQAFWDRNGTVVRVPARGQQRGFLVDWTEVSVADYARCVAEGACTPALDRPGCYSGELAKGAYPVNCVDQRQAQAWCAWAGRRLCTQDEHAWAARGPGDAIYPWGDAPPACERVVMDARGQQGPAGGPGCGRGSPWPVGSRPAGASAAGVLDISGNVAEWVLGDPGGAAGGGYMDKAPEELQRGGLRPLPPDLAVPDVGFRCCLDID
jgi:formylglycine-generating enzyme required for sulfatase activity